MSDESTRALFTAQQAMTLAESTNQRVTDLHGHLSTIAGSVEAMRAENARQHSDNGRKMEDGFNALNTRISSVKKTQDEHAISRVTQIGDLEKTVINGNADLSAKIEKVRAEALDGDNKIKEEHSKRWMKILISLLKYAGTLLIGILGAYYGLKI